MSIKISPCNPRKKQKYPELWLWDYSKDKGRGPKGFGVLILNTNGQGDVLHFNQYWDNEESHDFITSAEHRDGLQNGHTFEFYCELK